MSPTRKAPTPEPSADELQRELAAARLENVRLFNETKEALARQSAISEILRMISSSPSDVEPVLDTIARSAAEFIAADDVGVAFVKDGLVHLVAHQGPIEWGHPPYPIGSRMVTSRAIQEARSFNIADMESLSDSEFGQGKEVARRQGYRGFLVAPMLKDGAAIGSIALRRRVAGAFTPEQVELVETFAAQAVIAIENVRLFNETKEALERQSAVGEILRAIAGSPTDVQPVLEAIATNARRFCGAEDASLVLLRDNTITVGSHDGPVPRAWGSWPADGRTVTGRSIIDRRTVHVADLQADPGDEYPIGKQQALEVGERTCLSTPMVRDGVPLGAIVLRRFQVNPFTERQIELAETFAAQAVIAIENVRLFNEIQAKSAQLEVANDELAAASRHKSEFLANMSHELRTPLNAIIGFSDVLEQRLFGELNERQADYTRDIASSGRHLLDLVNEILDLSKVEAGRMELEPSEFALAETIHGALGFVRERAASHRIALTAEVPSDLGTVVADERKVRQVLLNLLSNAVKFTPDGGTIRVRASRGDGEIQVSVRDTGIGIAPEDQAKVFDEFQQVGKASDRSREGTGLGLTLAKRFVALHGGRIWIESEVGKGTTFTFAMPAGQHAAVAEGKS